MLRSAALTRARAAVSSSRVMVTFFIGRRVITRGPCNYRGGSTNEKARVGVRLISRAFVSRPRGGGVGEARVASYAHRCYRSVFFSASKRARRLPAREERCTAENGADSVN